MFDTPPRLLRRYVDPAGCGCPHMWWPRKKEDHKEFTPKGKKDSVSIKEDSMENQLHSYLKYEEMKPGRVVVRLVVQEILNSYHKTNYSITKLKKIQRLKINCHDPSGKKSDWQSKEISYGIIEDYVNKNNRFNYQAFDIYEIKCHWLDGSIELGLPQHIVGSNGKAVSIKLSMPFGVNFPISPTLDREGVLYNSFQNALTTRIISLHHKLIENSEKCFTPDWLYDFISLIANSISIVDITLNQLYIKAEYDPLPNWKCDKRILGERFSRRLTDKLKWVNQITGNPLDNVEKERKSLIILKNIRNHTQHFDPPCFGFTLEDAAKWLDMIPDIGSLLLKIRKKIGSSANEGILEMILLPKIVFSGIVLFNRERVPQNKTGYESTCWLDVEKEET